MRVSKDGRESWCPALHPSFKTLASQAPQDEVSILHRLLRRDDAGVIRVALYTIRFSEHSSRRSETLFITHDLQSSLDLHRRRYWRRALLVRRSGIARSLDSLRIQIRRLTANHERKGKVHENANRFWLCHRPQPDGDVGIPGDAAGPARPGHVVRHHSSRRWLRSRLAPRSLWRMPADVQLSARLAFGPVRPALLQELVGFAEAGTAVRSNCHAGS